MTIEEAILHAEEVADRCAVTDGDIQCENEHRQLAEWLKDYRRLKGDAKEEWQDIYAESEGSNSWIEFRCPHCAYTFGMDSGEYNWYYGDPIPWKYCPMCGGRAEHKPWIESEE